MSNEGELLSKNDLLELLLKHKLIKDCMFFYKLTKKGKLLFDNPTLSFEDVMLVPKYNPVASRSLVNLETKLTKNYTIPTPLLCSNMECVINSEFAIELWKHGVSSALHRFYRTDEEQIAAARTVSNAGVLTIVSCGVRETQVEVMQKCVDAGAKVIIIDVAHGFAEKVKQMAIKLREAICDKFNVDLIIGNICTAEAVDYLAPYADGLKCGIGTGSCCQTSVKTSAGGGQITAVTECSEAAKKHNINIISDGGVSEPGDAVKALAAGASSIMSGKLFVRCPESPAKTIEENGKLYKLYYGMASNMLKNKVFGEEKKHVSSEGISILYPIGLPAKEFVPEFLGAIRSGFTYSGASNIEELWKNSELRMISSAGYEKGKPHAQSHSDSQKISN